MLNFFRCIKNQYRAFLTKQTTGKFMANFDLQKMEGEKFKTDVTEEQAVRKFIELMETTSQAVVDKSFKMTGLAKFLDLKTSEEMDEIENLANFMAQIDLNFEWPLEGRF